MDIHWRADFTIKLLGHLSHKLQATSKVDADIVDEAIHFIILLYQEYTALQSELLNIGGPNDD